MEHTLHLMHLLFVPQVLTEEALASIVRHMSTMAQDWISNVRLKKACKRNAARVNVDMTVFSVMLSSSLCAEVHTSDISTNRSVLHAFLHLFQLLHG